MTAEAEAARAEALAAKPLALRVAQVRLQSAELKAELADKAANHTVNCDLWLSKIVSNSLSNRYN